MNIADLLLDRIHLLCGWRSWCPLIPVALAAGVVHYTIGWEDSMKGIFVALILVASLIGVGWQYVHEQRNGHR